MEKKDLKKDFMNKAMNEKITHSKTYNNPCSGREHIHTHPLK